MANSASLAAGYIFFRFDRTAVTPYQLGCVIVTIVVFTTLRIWCCCCTAVTVTFFVTVGSANQADRKRQADMKKAQLVKEAQLEEGEYEAAVR